MDAHLGFDAAVFDISWHPSRSVLASALVDGSLHLHVIGGDAPVLALRRELSAGSAVRSIRFASDGGSLIAGCSDCTLVCVDASGASTWRRGNAHASPVNVVLPLSFGSALVASGDDDGAVRLWDCRASPDAPPAAAFDDAAGDVVTALLADDARCTLLAASGDGTLCVLDLRKAGRVAARAPAGDEELLSLASAKAGSVVVAGTQDGVLLMWDWGKWGSGVGAAAGGAGAMEMTERFAGHPESIDALLAVDDDTVVTGSSDGLIRLVTLRPNKLVGILGEHGDDPVERLAWSADRRILASTSHDDAVRFWDVAYLFEEDEEEGAGAVAAAAAAAGGGGGGRRAAGREAGGGGGASQAGASRFVDMPALMLPRTKRGGVAGGEEEESGDDEEEEEEEGGGGVMDEEDMEEEAPPSKPSARAAKAAAAKEAAAARKGAKRGGGAGGGSFFADL